MLLNKLLNNFADSELLVGFAMGFLTCVVGLWLSVIIFKLL